MGICYCKGAEEIADERNTEINVSRRFGIEENKEGVVTNGRNGSKTPLPSKSPYRASPLWWLSPFGLASVNSDSGNSTNGTPTNVRSVNGTPSSAKSANRTPNNVKRGVFKRPFPPPSPAKHIQEFLLRRHGQVKSKDSLSNLHEGNHQEDDRKPLEKYFGYAKNFTIKYEIAEEVIGRGHFGYTCRAVIKKGDLKGQLAAVKVISKAKV